jgi:hypothetical protein
VAKIDGEAEDPRIAKLGEYAWRLRHGMDAILAGGDDEAEELADRIEEAEQEYGEARKDRAEAKRRHAVVQRF